MHWIKEPFRRCFDYSGRSRRREYWTYALLTFVAMILVSTIEEKLGLSRPSPTGGSSENGPLSGILFLCLAVPGLAVAVRRLHDSDRTGWWIALPVAPILFWMVALVGGFSGRVPFGLVLVAILVAPLILLVLMCLPGTRGPNRFGPDPKAENLADVFA